MRHPVAGLGQTCKRTGFQVQCGEAARDVGRRVRQLFCSAVLCGARLFTLLVDVPLVQKKLLIHLS